jgi:His-Xaa-Ser system radical SAM maturase HxsB
MEFQGGEPLLRFDLVREAVLYTNHLNSALRKRIDMVVCTNLTLLEDEHLDFFRQHGVLISTSLDGPALLHDLNRPSRSTPSNHAIVERNIRRAQEALGKQAVSALMTTTRESLRFPRQIVDEYLRLDLGSMFIRELNPYGYAVKATPTIGYTPEEFFLFYKEILNYLLQINRQGRTFPESYAALVLRKILTPWSVGFVDLQSPAAAGIGVVLYNYDGNVYPSDEARMLAETEDFSFRLGNVMEDNYATIFLGETMQNLASAACNESLAGCADCAYRVYCGADPVRHCATQRDLFGMRPSSGFCKKNMAIIRHLFELVFLSENDRDLERILWSWVNREDQALLQVPMVCLA